MSGAPPEYGTTATDFFSQLAPPGLQLLEPHDHHVVTAVSSQIGLSVWRIPFGGFFLVLCRDRHLRQVNFDTGWGTEVLKGRREVDTKPKWLERLLSTKG